jgi:hypothetical protein
MITTCGGAEARSSLMLSLVPKCERPGHPVRFPGYENAARPIPLVAGSEMHPVYFVGYPPGSYRPIGTPPTPNFDKVIICIKKKKRLIAQQTLRRSLASKDYFGESYESIVRQWT